MIAYNMFILMKELIKDCILFSKQEVPANGTILVSKFKEHFKKSNKFSEYNKLCNELSSDACIYLWKTDMFEHLAKLNDLKSSGTIENGEKVVTEWCFKLLDDLAILYAMIGTSPEHVYNPGRFCTQVKQNDQWCVMQCVLL